MNDVMRTLTLITTLFMPMSFLAAFFGMNFFQATAPFGAWTGRVAFGLMIVAMILLPLGMYLWIRCRAWM
jgi:magnesium transporter